VYLEEREPIVDGDTVANLESRLAAHGGRILVKTLDGIERGDLFPTPQSEDGMVYAHPITRKDGLLDPVAETAAALHRRVRAVSPKPGAWINLGDKTVKVLKAEPFSLGSLAPTPPGTIAQIRPNGISVTTADGSLLLIEEVQPENRAPMNAHAYSNGARLKVGDAVRVP
jgi:methionyl-tRNA formyltransferase